MGIAVNLRHVESFLNVFPGDNGEIRRRLSHLYVGISDEKPRINADVDEFKSWQPKDLRADAAKYAEAYVPSFLIELNKALKGYKNLKNSI